MKLDRAMSAMRRVAIRLFFAAVFIARVAAQDGGGAEECCGHIPTR